MTKQIKGFIFPCITVILFSTLEVASKLVGTELKPLRISFLRFLCGGLVLLPPAIIKMKKLKIRLTQGLALKTPVFRFDAALIPHGLCLGIFVSGWVYMSCFYGLANVFYMGTAVIIASLAVADIKQLTAARRSPGCLIN